MFLFSWFLFIPYIRVFIRGDLPSVYAVKIGLILTVNINKNVKNIFEKNEDKQRISFFTRFGQLSQFSKLKLIIITCLQCTTCELL